MEIGPIGRQSTVLFPRKELPGKVEGVKPLPGHGKGEKLRMLQKLLQQSQDDDVEEFDELDTNQDGIVDDEELEAAGLSPTGEFQSTQDFLSLLGVKTEGSDTAK